MHGKINNEAFANSLPGQTGTASPRNNRNLILCRNLNNPLHILHRPGDNHPGRHNLITGGIRTVQITGIGIRKNVSLDLGINVPEQFLKLGSRHKNVSPFNTFYLLKYKVKMGRKTYNFLLYPYTNLLSLNEPNKGLNNCKTINYCCFYNISFSTKYYNI